MTRAALLCLVMLSGCASQMERELTAFNEAAKLAPPEPGHPGNCTAHVAAVKAALAGRYPVRVLFSRSPWMLYAHVSALVDTERGTYVLDNGALWQRRDVFPLTDLTGRIAAKETP